MGYIFYYLEFRRHAQITWFNFRGISSLLYQPNGSWFAIPQVEKDHPPRVSLSLNMFSLKPANYLITSSMQLKIADFGLAT